MTALLGAWLWLGAGAALAQEPAPPVPATDVPAPSSPRPRGIAAAMHRRGLVALELAFTSGHTPAVDVRPAYDAVSLSPRFDARVPLFGRLAVDLILSLPWALVSAEGMDSAGAVRLGNPYLGGSLQWSGAASRLRWGLGVVVEIGSDASIEDDPATVDRAEARTAARNGAVDARAGFDSWLWAPDGNGLAMPARFETLVTDELLVEVDGSIALLTGRDGTFDPFLLVGAGGAWVVERIFALGGRLVICSGVPRDEDAAQASIEPFVRWADGIAEARLGVPIRFGGPLEPGWAVRASGALSW